MKKNYVLAFVLSMAVLFLWEKFIARPAPPVPAAPLSTAPAAADTPAAVPPAPPLVGERNVVFEIGQNRITFNRLGAGVSQWEVRDENRWLGLVRETPRQPLATFADLPFDVNRQGDAVVFTARRADGLTVRKTYTIDPAGYLHRLTLTFTNTGKAPVNADHEIGWGPGVEEQDPSAGGKGRAEAGVQRAIAYAPPRLFKYKPSTQTGAYQWWAVDGHYFMAAFLNDAALPPVTLTIEKDDRYFSIHRKIPLPLDPGRSVEERADFYFGPKGHGDLKKLGLGLEKSVDFGVFAPLGRLIHSSLLVFHRATGNFGWAIILLTVIIQILVLPLTVTSFRHGQKMKAIQPQLKRLQELYKSDPKRLNTEMLALYQRHGLRLMGMEGCFPVLIQLPVFWALYSTLSSTFELRHAPWVGWVKDLSVHDPFYVLPVLMGAGMFFQQKLSAASLDPNQRQIMYIMPVIFTFFFLKMPAGLVVYWLTSSLISITVQMTLLKMHERQEASR